MNLLKHVDFLAVLSLLSLKNILIFTKLRLRLLRLLGQIVNNLIDGVLIKTINVSMLFQPYWCLERKPFYLAHFNWNKVLLGCITVAAFCLNKRKIKVPISAIMCLITHQIGTKNEDSALDKIFRPTLLNLKCLKYMEVLKNIK